MGELTIQLGVLDSASFRSEWLDWPWPAVSGFEAGGAHIIKKHIGCNAQFFGSASFVPTTFAKRVFKQDTLDVQLRARGDILEAARPRKRFGHEVRRSRFRSNGSCGGRQELGSDFGAVRQDRGSFESVLKFTYVSWPGVGTEPAASAFVESEWPLAKFAAELFEKMSREEEQVIIAIPQRRDGERNSSDAEVEILAKEFFADAFG